MRNTKVLPQKDPKGHPAAGWAVQVSGRAAWVIGILVWGLYLVFAFTVRPFAFLYDWHVHAAGALGLLDGSLYQGTLTHPGSMPIDRFNYPPLAAAAAIPIAWLPDELGGTLWVILGVAAMGAASLLITKLLRLDRAWAGIVFAGLTLYPWAMDGILGNINPLMLFLILLFAQFHFSKRETAAGWVLAIAIGMKLWPLMLLPFVIRERRWKTFGVTSGVLAAQGLATIAILGVDVVPYMVADLTYRLPLQPSSFVIGPSAFDWWPAWGGYALAILFLAVPARGRAGMAMGILAGMALVPNLWRHYFPTIIVALSFIGAAALEADLIGKFRTLVESTRARWGESAAVLSIRHLAPTAFRIHSDAVSVSIESAEKGVGTVDRGTPEH